MKFGNSFLLMQGYPALLEEILQIISFCVSIWTLTCLLQLQQDHSQIWFASCSLFISSIFYFFLLNDNASKCEFQYPDCQLSSSNSALGAKKAEIRETLIRSYEGSRLMINARRRIQQLKANVTISQSSIYYSQYNFLFKTNSTLIILFTNYMISQNEAQENCSM